MLNPNPVEIHSDEGTPTDLVIDTFDQMHNSTDLRLWPTNWAAPVEPAPAP